MPFYFVSASDGTNVVKVCKCGILRTSLYLLYSVRRIGGGGVENIEYIFKLEQRWDLLFNCNKKKQQIFQLFKDAIRAAVAYKNNSTDFMDEIMRELEVSNNLKIILF